MKKQISILLFTLLSFTSCSDWLNVEPKTEVKSSAFFESEQGFKDALIGVYLVMTEPALYGKTLTCEYVEVMSRNYDFDPSNTQYDPIVHHIHLKSSAKIEQIWNRMYFAIANLNFLIYNLDHNSSAINSTSRAIIKGEALGLRAYLHFDLLRLFGWGDLEKEPDNLKKLCIPYVTTYEKSITKQSTVAECLEAINKDIDASIELLNLYDPHGVGEKPQDYNLSDDDNFFSNRHKRFNYWAALATKSRVLMWESKFKDAAKVAEKFIDKGDRLFPWIWDAEINNAAQNINYLFASEHIFQLNVGKLFENLRPFFDPGNDPAQISKMMFFQSKERVTKLFEQPTFVSDYRYRVHYDVSQELYSLKKFYVKDDYQYRNIMPLIRKTEFYYIAAEALARVGGEDNLKTAVDYLNTVRNWRGISHTDKLPDDLSAEDILEEVEKEWLREFVCEGQMFYYYKRLGVASVEGYPCVYIVPLPATEVILGGREDYTKKNKE